jgi:hypothetical protein
MKIVWYGHACFRAGPGDSVILIDPLAKGNPTFQRYRVAGSGVYRQAPGIEMPTTSLPKGRTGARRCRVPSKAIAV